MPRSGQNAGAVRRTLRRGRAPLSFGSALLIGAMALAGCTASPAEPTVSGGAAAAATDTAQEGTVMRVPTGEQAQLELLEAIAADDADAVREALLRGAQVEQPGENGATPLVVATKSRSTQAALALLDLGADPNAKDDIQDSAFLYAGAEGLDTILSATVKHGANVRDTNRYGGTALIPASEHGHVSTVKILLAAGVPVDHVNNLGWTALLEAIVLGNGDADHVETVRLLLEAGADPQLPDGRGKTPLELARAAGQDEIARLLEAATGN